MECGELYRFNLQPLTCVTQVAPNLPCIDPSIDIEIMSFQYQRDLISKISFYVQMRIVYSRCSTTSQLPKEIPGTRCHIHENFSQLHRHYSVSPIYRSKVSTSHIAHVLNVLLILTLAKQPWPLLWRKPRPVTMSPHHPPWSPTSIAAFTTVSLVGFSYSRNAKPPSLKNSPVPRRPL